MQVKGKGEEKLEQLYKNLQHSRDAYKQSNPTTLRKNKSADSNTTIKVLQLLDNSPRDLMAKLQLQALNVMRTRDLAEQEIIQERSEAIESGKLKGRRLFEYPMQNEGQVGSIRNVNGWSGMGQDSEVRSLSSFYNSEDKHEEEIESNGSKGIPDCSKSSSSSSSSPCISGASEDKDEEGKRVEDIVATYVAQTEVDTDSRAAGNIGGRYIVFLSGLAIALVILAISISLARRFGGCEVILVPT